MGMSRQPHKVYRVLPGPVGTPGVGVPGGGSKGTGLRSSCAGIIIGGIGSSGGIAIKSPPPGGDFF